MTTDGIGIRTMGRRRRRCSDVHNAEFNDPRLVEVYDAECTWTIDDDYFVRLLDETPGARVIDIGCGTGRLPLRLASLGYEVTGIDPSAARASHGFSAPRSRCLRKPLTSPS